MYHFNYNFRFVASCILTFYLVLCFEESHGNYSYFKKDVVKLVDFVDSIDWINFNDLILDGGAKVAAKTQNQQLLLDRGSSAKQIVKRKFKYLILNYLGTEKHKMFEVTLDGNSNCQLYSYSSYNNQIWTCSSNNSYPGVLKVKSVYSKKKLVQRIGISNVTKYKTFGVLQEDGKKRLEEIDAFLKPQLFVAILGLRGSGKSTIASLLSGNHEMFVQERRSTHTTTSGIDISPIISTEEYIPAVNDALKTNFSNIDSHFPLVITDSEGMGVRGDDIDFVSTIPPLLFSNIILWVTTDSLRLDEELTKLDRYLNLANRIQDNSGKLCSSFQGGRLIVIINKMQGDESDKELNDELLGLAPELENIELDSAKPLMQDSETDEEVVDELSILKSEFADFESEFAAKTNSIRQKLKKCFKSIQVVGFPYLILPKTEKYLKYTNIKGEGSGRFKQSLIKLISLILKERDQVRVLAGTVVTPKIMINLFQLVLEKINSGAKFLDIDLMDNLFTVNIKQNLTEYEFLFNKRLNEIERTKKIEAVVEAVRSLTDRNKNKLSVLLEQSQNERQIRITMEEWNATEARLTKLMESMMTYRFNATISESHSLLTKLLPICMFLPAKYHHCLGNYFSGRLSSYRRLINLSPLGNKKIIYDTVDLFDKEIDAAFVRCSQQRMIFASAQRAETENLLQKGIGIIKSVKSVGDKNKAYTNFTDLRDNILKKERLTVPSFDMPCHLRDFSEERRGIIDHIDSSFSKGLNRLQNLLSFHKQRTPLEMQLDFSNTLPEIVENGKTVRIFQQSCDLSYILRYILRPHIKELNLICFHVKIDGNTTTQLRKLSIQAINLNINNKGSTLCLEKPETPSKSKLSQPGQTGYNGGVVSIKVHFKVSGGVLIIEANGGDGGDGGDGIPGSQGADGKNGIIETKYYDKQYYDSLNNTNLIKRESLEGLCSTTGRKSKVYTFNTGPYGTALHTAVYPEEICSTLTTFDKDFKYTSANAMPGESGSRGSSGGSGGNGGDPGMLRLDIPVRYRKHFSVTAEGGKGGKGGNGGIGGLGGMNGKNKILEATYTRVWESFDKDNLKYKYPTSWWSRSINDGWRWEKSVDAEKAEEQEKYLIKQGKLWFRSPPEDFYDRFPNRISSSNLVPREKLMEREKNGDIGKSGKKGEDGNKNERKGQTENITLDNFSLFTMFQEINSYSLKETEELSYNGERSMPRMKLYIENMIALAAQQKIGLLNLKAHYETQMIGKSLINVIESEINLTRRLMHDYTARQNFLREDFETYAKELNSIDDKISQFDTGCFKYIVNKLRDRILTESKYQYMKDMKEMKEKLEEERQKTNKLALGILFDIAMISTAFVGNYGGAVSGIHGLSTGLMDLASVKQISNSSDISREYLSRVISNFNITDKLSEELENFVKDVSDTGMKDKIDLGVTFTELMKAYTPVPLASSVISTRLRRHEVRQLISQVKSVIFEVSSILGAKNIPELDSLTSLIDLKVEFTEKVIAVTSEISNIQLKIDEFQRRIEGLSRTSAMTLNNTASAHYVNDMIVTNAMLNFFSTGKEIYSSLYNFMRITAYIRQSNDFFSNIPPFSPLSTSEEFRTALKFISNQINIQSFIHNGEVEIVLDEIDFPNEFKQLRKRRHATFPILNSGKGNTWVKSVKANLTNVSSDGTYYTIAIEHSGSQLFDFDGDLKLNPVVLESTYKNKNTGPEWKMLPKPTYNSIELIHYPFSSNYKIRIPENYKTLNIVSNRNINMSSVRQIVLFFEFWEEK